MKILVCVKQIIEPVGPITIREDGKWLNQDDALDYRINYYDTYAMEAAVRIKETFSDTLVDAVSVGPADIEPTLRHALALGADNAIHIKTREKDYLPADITGRLIADYVSVNPCDLILAGVMSEDTMQSLTGPVAAAHCGIPCATAATAITVDPVKKTADVVCELEGGINEQIRLGLPALITVQSGINQPRYASLSNRLRAKSQLIEVIDKSDDAAMPGQYQKIRRVFVPEKTAHGEFLEGSSTEKARVLVSRLHERSIL
ncbi:MAG: electron transfer flavoprotein subunit beta/FixA family protein [Thermodesulfobacteriota bacterium]|nr:electron transfer flavoprotein subunit beta/FixA family protein [Thermodesulfobacteriota bacterium]